MDNPWDDDEWRSGKRKRTNLGCLYVIRACKCKWLCGWCLGAASSGRNVQNRHGHSWFFYPSQRIYTTDRNLRKRSKWWWSLVSACTGCMYGLSPESKGKLFSNKMLLVPSEKPITIGHLSSDFCCCCCTSHRVPSGRISDDNGAKGK